MAKEKPWLNPEFLKREYVENRKSTSAIAKECGTYPMTIRRALKKFGFEIRDKSKAQKNNIEINGSPLQGRKRTEDEKMRISMTLQEHWDNMSDEEKFREKTKRSMVARKAWAEKTPEEKTDALKKMQIGNRSKVRKGSKNENMVADFLINVGFDVHQRSKQYTPGRRFEIDIAIPDIRIAIEWDGPNHFKPLYGEEKLQKVQAKDEIKNQVLVRAGWTVIRVRDRSSTPTLAVCRRASDAVIDLIENGEKNVVHIIDVS